jgi:hypothetical protein
MSERERLFFELKRGPLTAKTNKVADQVGVGDLIEILEAMMALITHLAEVIPAHWHDRGWADNPRNPEVRLRRIEKQLDHWLKGTGAAPFHR